VNAAASEIDGQPSVASVRDLPEPADLAVVAVLAAAVPQVIEDCAARGVKALVVISAISRRRARKAARVRRRSSSWRAVTASAWSAPIAWVS
jgi:acyl-CoA synthetase (NDP forming)